MLEKLKIPLCFLHYLASFPLKEWNCINSYQWYLIVYLILWYTHNVAHMKKWAVYCLSFLYKSSVPDQQIIIFIIYKKSLYYFNKISCFFFSRMFFQIDRTWDDKPINHEPVKLAFGSLTDSIYMEIKAPYFNDPVPPGQPGQSYHRLWDYEGMNFIFKVLIY